MKSYLFRIILILTITQILQSSETEQPELKPLIQEDLELTRENLLQKIEDHKFILVLFYEKSDKKLEFVTNQIRKAIIKLAQLKNFPSDKIPVFGTYEAPVIPKFEKLFKVYKFPKLILFINGKRFPYNGQRVTTYMLIPWYKRILRDLDRTNSRKLKDKEMLGILIDKEGTAVVYCGNSKEDKEFQIYEEMAKDSQQIYLYIFDDDFCRRLHARSKKLESRLEYIDHKEVPMTEKESQDFHDAKMKDYLEKLQREEIDEEEYKKYEGQYPKMKVVDEKIFNETLYKELKLEQPGVFVVQKNVEEKSAVKFVEKISSVKNLRWRIKREATPAYYTDIDNFHMMNGQTNYGDDWFILVYRPEDARCTLNNHFKAFARKLKFQRKNFNFGIFGNDVTTAVKVEKTIPMEGYHRLYYIDYRSYGGGNIRKYRALNIKKIQDIEKYFNYMLEGTWDEYFFEEEPVTGETKHNYPNFQKLTRESYYSEIKNRIGNLVIVLHKGFSHKMETNTKDVRRVLDRLEKVGVQNLVFKHINVGLNDVLEPGEEKMISAPRWVLYQEDSDEVKSAVNLEGEKAILRFLETEIEQIRNALENEEDL